MGDAYQGYGATGKRPRSEFDVFGGHEFPSHIAPDDGRAVNRGVRDTDSIQASYDQYLRSTVSAYGGGESKRHTNVGVSNYPGEEDPRIFGYGLLDTSPLVAKGRPIEMGEISRLPHDASNTLFVEGLPSNCTRREVSHIFRPFVGYKEVRLVSKEVKHQGDPLVLCFVDFVSPAHAATAMDALQGYKFDEHDRDSVYLRIQFARNPGLKTGGGHRRKR